MRRRSSLLLAIPIILAAAASEARSSPANSAGSVTFSSTFSSVGSINQNGGGLRPETVESRQILLQLFGDQLQELSNYLVSILTGLIRNYPNVVRQDVMSVHEDVFAVSVVLAGVFLSWIGLLLVLNLEFNVRRVVHVVGAVAVGGVAPHLLNLLIKLSESVTMLLQPAEAGLASVLQFSTSFLLIAFLNSLLLIGIAVVFLVRDAFFVFVAAASPLLGLGYAFPYTRRFTAPLFGVFGAFLIIGPLNMIVFRLSLAFFKLQPDLPEYLLSIPMFVLLLGIPYILLSSGMAAVGTGTSYLRGASVPNTVKRKAQKHVPGYEQPSQDTGISSRPNKYTTRRRRGRRR